MLTIQINNQPCSDFGLTPLRGCLGELMQPAKRKNIVTNTNTNINGDVVLPLGTAVQSRTVTLFFKIEGNGSLVDLQDALELLEIELLRGTDGKGTNEIFVEELGRTFYMVYQEMSDYSNFGEMPKATLRIKFLEPNPRNH